MTSGPQNSGPYGSGPQDGAPLVLAPAQAVTSAGTPVDVPLTIVNTSSRPQVFLLSAVGVDADWLPRASRSTAVAPGAEISATITLHPAAGTVAARYPLLIAVQALDVATGDPRAATVTVELELLVDAPGQVNVVLDPVDSSAVFGARVTVQLTNSGTRPETVYLETQAPSATSVRLPRDGVHIAPQSTVVVTGRVSVAHPTLFRRKTRHAFMVTARSSGAPRYAEGSLTARSVIGPVGTKALAMVAIVAVWVAVALMIIPRLADSTKAKQAEGTQKTHSTSSTAPGKDGSNGPGGSGGSGGSDAPDGNGTPANSTPGAPGAAKTVNLNGTVSGAPAGVTVSITSSADGAGSEGSGAHTTASQAFYKLTPDAVIRMPETTFRGRAATTKKDGAWSLSAPSVGLYTLTFAKAGYQEQRYQVDTSLADATKPMAITMVPGTGSMSGSVSSAAGPVKGATITISDGTNVLTTSTNSTGTGLGDWAITGLSTPSTYLVSASAPGLGTVSKLVDVAAKGSPVVDLTMSTSVATLSGTVSDTYGHRIGAAQVIATDGTTTRSVSTVSQGTGTGVFVLPDLTLGTWSVTVQASGFQLQSRKVTVAAGRPLRPMLVTLNRATVTVTGEVTAAPSGKKLPGAGLILSNAQNTYKQTALNSGHFAFDNVAPGTYSLSAQYFGYVTGNQSVTAVVGKIPHPADFELQPAITANASKIQGFVGNAAASGGSIGCQTSPVVGCSVSFALKDQNGRAIATTVNDNGDNSIQPSVKVGTDGGALFYTIAVKTSPGSSQDGLAPGAYTLIISSPGYLPAKITVRVPLNSTATAPQVNLFPANTISGNIGDAPENVNGDINPDDLARIGTGANCMLAIPVNYTGAFDSTKFGCNAQTANGYDPTYLATLTKSCTDNGTAVPAVGIIADTGRYTIPGLCDGTYYVIPVIANPAFDASTLVAAKVTQTVVHGQTAFYSPHLPRKPVLKLVVNQQKQGATSPVKLASTSVLVECRLQSTDPSAAPDVSETVTTDGGGAATVYGIPAGFTSCDVSKTPAPGDTDPKVTGSTGMLYGSYDSDIDASAVIVDPLPPVFGRIVSKYAASDTNPVVGAQLAVSAVTGYIGSSAQTTTTTFGASFVTNANGCFAVARSYPVAPADIPSGCGTLGQDNVLVLTLTSRAVSVAVADTVPTRALGFTPVTLSDTGIPQIPVTARTVDTSGLAFSSVPNGVPLDNATVQVTSSTAHGSGTLNPSVNASGQLVWSDSNAPALNQAWQGTYNLTVKVPGFSDTQAVLTCGPTTDASALTCALDNTSVVAYGTISGRVTLSGTTTAVANATVIARPCGTSCPAVPAVPSGDCPTATAADHTTTTDGGGQYSFLSSSGARYLPAGHYQVIVCASGLLTTYLADLTVVGGPNPSVDLTMMRLGGVSGVVSFSDGTASPPTVTVTLEQLDSKGNWNVVGRPATTDGSGFFTMTDTDGSTYFLDPSDTGYRITYVANGYQQLTTSPFAVKSGMNSGSITLTARGGVSGKIVASGGGGVPIVTAQVTLRRGCTTDGNGTTTCTGAPQTVGVDGSGVYQFTSGSTPYFLTPGELVKVSVSAPNYVDDSAVVTVVSGNKDVSFTLDLRGAVSGHVSDTTANGPGIAKATITAYACSDSTCATTYPSTKLQTVSDPAGDFTFQVAGNTNIFSLNYWTFTVSAGGYQDPTTPIILNVASGSNTLPIVLLPLGGLSGTVSSAGSPTDKISGVTVAAQLCKDATATVCDGVTKTTNADEFGKYSFTDPVSGTSYVFAPGTWQITVTAFGYLDTVTSKTLASGANTLDLVLQVRLVTQPITLKMTGGSIFVKHAIVTLRRNNDATGTDIPTTRSGTTYTPAALVPTGYTAYITGDATPLGQSIVSTSSVVNVPLIDVDGTTGKHADTGPGLANAVTIPVTVLQSTITGSVAGRTGTTATTNLGGISVELVLADGTTPAVDTGDNPINTKTTPLGGFTLAGIPNGTYSLRINGPDPTTQALPDNGWVPTTTTATSLGYGQVQQAGTITLDPTKALVDVTVTYDKADDITGAAPTLNPSTATGTWGAQSPTSTTPDAAKGTVVYEFSAVPHGCWTFALGLPSTHKGTISLSPIAGNPCDAGYLPVDASGAKATAAYTLDEHVLTVTSTVTPNPADSTSTPTIRLGVKNGSTVVSDTPVTDATVTTLYLPGGTYSIGLSLDPATPRSPLLWPLAAPKDVNLTTSSQSRTLSAVEAALQTLTVTHFAGAKAGTDVTVTVRCDDSQNVPDGCGTLGSVAALTQTDKGSGASFANLAPGKWTVQITGTLPDVPPAKAGDPSTPGGTFTKHQQVTLSAGGSNTTTTTWIDGPAS